MAWRKSGLFRTAEEILVMTCDVCERDIGYEDGSRSGSGRALPLNNPQTVPQARHLREFYPGTAGAFQWKGRASSVCDMRRAHQSSPQRLCVAVSANP